MSRFHELRVNAINRETPEAISVGFEVPPELKEDFKFAAGQYLTLEKEIAGKKFRRSYSICTAPDSGELKVTVKEIADGRFSAWVNKKLKEGDTLNVFLPEGRFVFNPPADDKPRTYAAFAAGSGITPVMAILQTILQADTPHKFVLIYGNKTPEQTIFYQDLLTLQKKYPGRFFVHFMYSRLKEEKSPVRLLKKNLFYNSAKEKPNGEQPMYGRIESVTADFILHEKYRDFSFEDFYLCGPQGMIDAVSARLVERGVSEERIHFELFVTEEEKKIPAAVSEGKTKVTVILDEEEVVFDMDRQTRVLNAVMDAGLDPPYSCQGGICSSCLAQIEEGEATMVNNQILTDKEVRSGLVLTCQAHPTTPTLVVNYDDV